MMFAEGIFVIGLTWFSFSVGLCLYALIAEAQGKLDTETGRL